MSDNPKDPEAPKSPDVDEPVTDGVVLPFLKRWQRMKKRGSGAEAKLPETMEDGTTLHKVRTGWASWSVDGFPRQRTCMNCFRERRAEHESCELEECDCYCVDGKRWPLWAHFGPLPPQDEPIPRQLL